MLLYICIHSMHIFIYSYLTVQINDSTVLSTEQMLTVVKEDSITNLLHQCPVP